MKCEMDKRPFYWIAVLLTVVVVCGGVASRQEKDLTIRSPKHALHIGSSTTIETHEYEGHEFVVVRYAGRPEGITHSPNCPCSHH